MNEHSPHRPDNPSHGESLQLSESAMSESGVSGSVARPAENEVAALKQALEDCTRQLGQAEATLHRGQRQAHNLLEGLIAFVAVLSAKGEVQEINRALLEAGGVAREEVVGQPLAETFWWSYAPAVQQRLREAVRRAAEGETVRYTEVARVAGEKRAVFDVVFAPLRDAGGEIAQIIASSVDISDRVRAENELVEARTLLENRVDTRTEELAQANRNLTAQIAERQMAMGALREAVEALEITKGEAEKAREEAERANAAKSEFLSRMSHELRTPLNAILGFGQVLEMEELSEEQGESVAFILKGGEHLLGLINEVLDISRVESGNIELSLEPVSVVSAVQECLDLTRPLALNRTVHLDAHLENMGEVFVLADQQRLKQVLLNLLANGIKYNRDSGQVNVHCVVKSNGILRIEVRDTGHGIAHQDLERLFVPFDRLGAEASGIEGTGLGLMLSRRLTEAMGGQLDVESVLGQGSTFFVELALTQCPLHQLKQGGNYGLVASAERPALSADVSALRAEGARTESSAPRQKILCVEDNEANTRVIEAVLGTRSEISLLCATHGQNGLQMAREHHPDLIVLDLHLPDIPGSEVLRQLQLDPQICEIPVVVLSADATEGQIRRLLDCGAKAYLTKPLDVRHFLQVVEEVLHS